MKDYSQIVSKVTSAAWMITPDALRMMLELLDSHMSGNIPLTAKQGLFDMDDKPPMSYRAGSVGVINLSGPIFPKANLMTDMSGATSLEQFTSEFRSLMADGNVKSIVMSVDSPGGVSDMVHETAMEVREASQVKPVYSIANTAANSAAYYIASQATQMFASPSAQLGSIGTYVVHTDTSEAEAKLGVKNTVIKAGRFKAATLEPLTEESHNEIQKWVNEVNDQFVTAVAEGRQTTEQYVREHYGQGMIVSPNHALANRMIDGIMTFDDLMSNLSRQEASVSANSLGTAASQTGYVYTTTDNTNIEPFVFVPGSRQSYDADKEHSEPGTGLGGEPTPREPPETGDKAIEGGWRRDPPPIAYEEMEEMAVNRAWLEERATALNIEFDADMSDEDLASKVAAGMDAIVIPLADATADATKQLEFEKTYPEQAKQLAELRESQRAGAAKDFASQYARFEGSNKGFSTLVRDKIEEAHAKIALRQFSQIDLKELLDLTASKESVVEWGEQGSSREGENQSVAPTRNFVEDRKQFANLVRTAMTEDNLSREAAIEHVSKQNPELAEAYLHGHAR